MEYKLGFTVTGALGYGFGNGFRTELEIGYGRSKSDEITVNGGDDVSLSAFAEVGAAINISKGFAIVPSLRYIWLDDGGSGFENSEAWAARLGLASNSNRRGSAARHGRRLTPPLSFCGGAAALLLAVTRQHGNVLSK